MTDREKLEKLKKLADAMFYAAQQLTTDASRLHKAMDEYRKFIIHECKEEPVSEDLREASYRFACKCHPLKTEYSTTSPNPEIIKAFKAGAKWQKEQMIKNAIDGIARPDDNEVWCDLKSFNFKDGDKVKLIVIKEE